MEIKEHQGSSGTAKAGLTTGIIGTSLGALAGLAELTGIGRRSAAPAEAAMNAAAPALGVVIASALGKNGCNCSEDHTVNRYELAQGQKIAELQSQIALRDANPLKDIRKARNYADYFYSLPFSLPFFWRLKNAVRPAMCLAISF